MIRANRRQFPFTAAHQQRYAICFVHSRGYVTFMGRRLFFSLGGLGPEDGFTYSAAPQ